MRILLSVLLLLQAFSCWAGADVALVKRVEGAPTVVRNGESLEAKSGMKLYVTDKVVAGQGASIGIVFNDGTTLSAGPSTELDLSEYVFDPAHSKYAFSMFLKKGTLIYSSGKLGKLSPDSVKLNTPRSTIGVRGTRLVLNYE